MKKLIITTLIISFGNLIIAQKNLLNGYIIINSNDTLKGKIDNQEWTKSPNRVFFTSPVDEKGQYYDTEIDGFGIYKTNENYVTKTFQIEKLNRDFNKSTFGSISKYARRKKDLQSRTAFLKIISSGKINLLQFIDADNEEHFIIDDMQNLKPLIKHDILIDGTRKELDQYKNQLKEIFGSSCVNVTDIDKLTYKYSSIQKIIDTYNGCFESKDKPKSLKADKGKIEFGLMGGVNYTNIEFYYKTSTISGNFTDTETGNWKFSPIAGIFFNYDIARNRNRIGIANDLQYYNIKSDVIKDNINAPSRYYDISYIALKNMARIKIKVDKPTIYVLAGISNGFIVSSKDEMYKKYRKHEEGIIGGIGIGLNKTLFEIRGTRGTGHSGSLSAFNRSNQLEFTIKYLLIK